ncbi:YdcF family protein [Nocardia sp. GAS34]|uniref:YdcF family protein n=1 Tax=unclassified Nocardia TaxID=2637762 RepID=UPI003D192FDA
MRTQTGGVNLWRAAVTAVVSVSVLIGASEWLHWRASRRFPCPIPGPLPPGGTHAVVVLGYPAKADGSPHPLQTWRCRIAERSMPPGTSVIFTGGPVSNQWAEAEVMAAYARDVLGIPAAAIRTETESESTWQNIEFTIPMIEHADRISIVSSPMHAARARRYLYLQRPDLAARLTPADDYRFLDAWWLKLPTAAYETSAIVRRRVGHAVVRILGR